MNRVFVCAVASVLLACGARISGDTLRVDLHYNPSAISPVRAALASSSRQAMVRIAVPGFCSSVSSGDPALPCRLIYVALPPNTDVSSVKIPPGSYSTTVLPGSYDLAPVPATATSARKTSFGVGKAIAAGRNTRTYSRDEFYPKEQIRLVQVGNMRTWKVAVLEFWPYAYNPTTGRVRSVSATTAALDYTTTSAPAAAVSDPIAERMAGLISNGTEAKAWYPSSEANAPSPGYAIVTTKAIVSASTALQDFVAYQKARGFSVKVATEDDWGGGTGNTAADRIRAWLKSNYLTLNLQYVLLIGNPHPSYGDVPMKMLWPRLWSYSYKEAPSDYYYSDLTGNWDRDGDGYFGEEPDDFGTGGIDRIPEVYVGRIPYYGNTAALDSILRKTTGYRSSVQGGWLSRFLLPMKPMDADTPSYQLGEQIIRDFGWYSGMNPDRVYDDDYDLSMLPEHMPCDYDVVQNEWASGAGLVFWMTHGSTNTAGNVFSSSRCNYLDDSKPSIVYMASCSNGSPEDSGNLGYCVLAKGGITTFSASRVSWYYLAETDFTATDSIGGLGYQYARFLLSGEPCGQAAMDARLANPVSIWANHLVYNLYGDPSLVYDPVAATQRAEDVGSAKQIPDGTHVRIENVVLTRTPDARDWYVQDANRCAGMRVTGQWTGAGPPQSGSMVSVTGELATDRGMRTMLSAQVDPLGGTVAAEPLGVQARWLLRDTKTLGLLVTVWGQVLSASGSSFTITGATKRLPTTILCSGTIVPPPVGKTVRVVGVSTPDGVVVSKTEDITQIGR